ncbi:MAG TPA: hypothetical protein DIW38_01785 [Oceanicaulis sp.]|nr:hypothetical protein [Oceanicaulis sp.]
MASRRRRLLKSDVVSFDMNELSARVA